ncbi:polysaccharide lyase family 8 super-sandwich domain-containing protein [Lentisphaerota bacterium WC36G]|nr:polysaccharide lyase beta-sandwich domain-containing protein [Lentisphaerae bacterium WC36]
MNIFKRKEFLYSSLWAASAVLLVTSSSNVFARNCQKNCNMTENKVMTVSKDTLAKMTAMNKLREKYSKVAYRGHQVKSVKQSVAELEKLLNDDGVFTDLKSVEEKMITSNVLNSLDADVQGKIGLFFAKVTNRLWKLAETFRNGKNANNVKLRNKIYKGFIHYGMMEMARPNIDIGRFHASCFAIPNAAINSYFCFFKDMEDVEKDKNTSALAMRFHTVIRELGFQAWTQPYRHDETDKNIVSVERFRKHVWWVGGNGIAYRPVISAAIMMNDIRMLDVLSEVAREAISVVSQTNYDDAFWTEGFTADGAGWGHGMQCLVWGYPIHGASSALAYMNILRDTPWAGTLQKKNVDVLFNFFRGSSFLDYKGYIPPVLGRGNMMYSSKPQGFPSLGLIKNVYNNWSSSLTLDQREELKVLIAAMEKNDTASITKYPYYSGLRYFYNNDNFVKKEANYYAFISMGSIRVDGIESTKQPMAAYNYYTSDGLTLFMRAGNEATLALGGMNLTAFPGVTARQGEEKLQPITNWRGFVSKHNFAAGTSRQGSPNGVSGFIFEKINASTKSNVNDLAGLEKDNFNKILYGVKAHKGYFFINDLLVCLGAGVTNLTPEVEGDVWTTIDQTLWQNKVAVGDRTFRVDGKCHEIIVKKRNAKTSREVVQEDKFSYYIIPEQTVGEVKLICENRPEKWSKLATKNKGKNYPKDVNMFQLAINHGREFKNDTYGYIVNLGNEKADYSSVKIISNTTELQAVTSADNKVITAVFYNKNAVLKTSSKTITVSEPCTLMIEDGKESGIVAISVTDAEMNVKLNNIVVTINNKKYNIPLPTEPNRGQSVSKKFKL